MIWRGGAPEASLLGGLGGSLGGLLHLLALLALEHGVGHDGGDQLDGADGVVVAGDDVIDLIGVAVGVGDGHDGDAQLVRLGDGVALLAGVHDEQRFMTSFLGSISKVPSSCMVLS